jgi:hypothetical protein
VSSRSISFEDIDQTINVIITSFEDRLFDLSSNKFQRSIEKKLFGKYFYKKFFFQLNSIEHIYIVSS